MKYNLDSGIQLHEESPETFWIPSEDEKKKLQVNDIVKLVFREIEIERMWVIITKIEVENGKIYFEGTLDNQPYYLESIKYQDKVIFNEDHIIDYQRDDSRDI